MVYLRFLLYALIRHRQMKMLVGRGAFALVEGSPRRSRHHSKHGSESQVLVTKKGSRRSKSEKVSQLS